MFRKHTPIYVLAFRGARRGELFFPEGQNFHRVAVQSGAYYYVRAQPALPPGAEGYIFTASGGDLRQLRRLERRRGVRLGLYPSLEDCLAAAPARLGGRFLFGGGEPAGALLEAGVVLFPLEAAHTEPEVPASQSVGRLRTWLERLLGR